MAVLRRLALFSFALFLSFAPTALWSQTLPSQSQQPEIRTGFWRGAKITYQWFPGPNGTGKAVYQGDILLDNVQDSPNGAGTDSQGIGVSKYLWQQTGGVYQVPYQIDSQSGDVANIQTAITNFNAAFSGVIQFVPYVSQTDWVDFNLSTTQNNGVCESFEGRAGGEQMATGAGGPSNPCTVATIQHEMGHIVGSLA